MATTREARIEDADLLRRRLCDAQAGCEVACREMLHWAADRVGGTGGVGITLRLLHRLRHTYHPSACPESWLAGIIAAASRTAGTPAD